MSGSIPIFLEGKERPVRPHPAWMSSTISSAPWACAMSATRRTQSACRGVQPAFALHGFQQDRRRRVEPRRPVLEHGFQQIGGVDPRPM
jgi:hypothetical protein